MRPLALAGFNFKIRSKSARLEIVSPAPMQSVPCDTAHLRRHRRLTVSGYNPDRHDLYCLFRKKSRPIPQQSDRMRCHQQSVRITPKCSFIITCITLYRSQIGHKQRILPIRRLGSQRTYQCRLCSRPIFRLDATIGPLYPLIIGL